MKVCAQVGVAIGVGVLLEFGEALADLLGSGEGLAEMLFVGELLGVFAGVMVAVAGCERWGVGELLLWVETVAEVVGEATVDTVVEGAAVTVGEELPIASANAATG